MRRNSRSKRAQHLAIVAALGLGLTVCSLSLLACEAILGIEEKPLRSGVPRDGESTDVTDGGAVPDAESCDRDADESKGCARSCAELCSDFDIAGQEPDRGWDRPSGFANPIAKGEEAGVEVAPPGNSAPQGLRVKVGSASGSSFAMLVDQLRFEKRHAGKTFDGVRGALDLRITKITFTETGRGPIKDAGNSSMLGFLRGASLKPKGIAVIMTGTNLYLSISEDIFGGNGASEIVEIASLNLATLLNNWVRVQLFVGTKERAVALGFNSCPDPGNNLVAASVIGSPAFPIGSGCAVIPETFDADAGPKSWAEAPVLGIGGLLFDRGEIEFQLDNVVADFYEK